MNAFVRGDRVATNDNGLIIVRCFDGHEWYEQLVLPMPMAAFVSRLKEINSCPQCGRRNNILLEGEAFRDAKRRLLGAKRSARP